MSTEDVERSVPSPEQLTSESGVISPTTDHSFLLQAMMENQRTLGEVKNAVDNLQSTVGEHGRKIERISHIVYAAGAVLIVISGIATFVIDKIWDHLVALLRVSGGT